MIIGDRVTIRSDWVVMMKGHYPSMAQAAVIASLYVFEIVRLSGDTTSASANLLCFMGGVSQVSPACSIQVVSIPIKYLESA